MLSFWQECTEKLSFSHDTRCICLWLYMSEIWRQPQQVLQQRLLFSELSLQYYCSKFNLLTRKRKIPGYFVHIYTHYLSLWLGRTFPTHQYFSAQLGAGQLSLYNLLKAYSLLDTEVHTVIPTVAHFKACTVIIVVKLGITPNIFF